MAAVSQEITSYLSGVSRQADKEKAPGFVRDARNAYPDATFGMTKRPGFEYVREIGSASDYKDSFWFLFRWTEYESYVGAVTADKSIKLWNFQTGVECTVTNSSDIDYFEVPDGETPRNYFDVLQKQDGMLILNRSVVTAMDTSTLAPGTITGRVNTLAELPTFTELSVGDIYEVIGIAGNQDDYVLIWDGQTWEETVYPGVRTDYDASTMPHQLVRTDVNTFTFGEVDWDSRPTGKPSPNLDGPGKRGSFVGHTINEMFFYKNRLGFLSEDAVIMSQPLEFFNFWRMSSMTQSDADPVDLVASSLQPITLTGVLPVTQGLLLFSQREQFLMTGGSDGLITPSAGTIRSISSFEMDTTMDPVLMDTTAVFTAKGTNYTRVFTMDTQGQNDNPQYTDIGKIVSEWIPKGLDRLGADSQNDLVFMSGPELNSIYMFRRYVEGGELLTKAWVRWEMPGKVLGMFFENDVIWTVVNVNGKIQLLKGNVNPTPTSTIVSTEDGLVVTNPCIDFLVEPSTMTYDNATKQTTITFPFDDIGVTEWEPIAIQVNASTSTYDIRVGRNTATNASGTFWKLEHVSGATFKVNANLTEATIRDTIRVGYTFPFDIVLPKYYMRVNGSADFSASLIIARYRFTMGKTGAVAFEVRPRGSDVFTGVGEVEQSNWYRLDTAPIDDERIFTLPIHQRNDNFDVRISSDSPYPVSLLSMKWEGQYSPRYYARS